MSRRPPSRCSKRTRWSRSSTARPRKSPRLRAHQRAESPAEHEAGRRRGPCQPAGGAARRGNRPVERRCTSPPERGPRRRALASAISSLSSAPCCSSWRRSSILTNINGPLQQGIAAGPEHLRAARCARRGRGRGCAASSRRAARSSFRNGEFPLPAGEGPGPCRTVSLQCGAGRATRHRGAVRQRQEHAGQPDPALLRPDFEGTVLVDGHDVREYRRSRPAAPGQPGQPGSQAVRRHYPQQHRLRRDARRERRGQIEAAARAAHVLEFTDRFPTGSRPRSGDRGVTCRAASASESRSHEPCSRTPRS
jgi:hypothetical protein